MHSHLGEDGLGQSSLRTFASCAILQPSSELSSRSSRGQRVPRLDVPGNLSHFLSQAIFSPFQKIPDASDGPHRYPVRNVFPQAILGDNAVMIVAESFLEFSDLFDAVRHVFAGARLS